MKKDVAYREFMAYLVNTSGKVIQRSRDLNKGRHKLIVHDNIRYYMVYQNEQYMTFRTFFATFVEKNPNFDGNGESINKSYLEFANSNSDYMVFLYDKVDGDRKIYKAPTKLIYKFCHKHNLIREQNKENNYVDGSIREKTYCFPIKLLEDISDEVY